MRNHLPQIQALEEKTQAALEKAEKALKECQSAKAAAKKCKDIFERITARQRLRRRA
jgi:hypothetical protein